MECERAARLCWQRSVHFLQFMLRIWLPSTRLQRAAGRPRAAFPPAAGGPGPATKLSLARRLAAATGPTRCRSCATLAVTSDGFLSSRFEGGAASLNVGRLHTCLIRAACVWRIKIHERRRSGCQGLWQRSSSAQVLRGECWGD